jgi:DnaJ like chaperone protein
MAKADGVVTRDEIIAFKEVFKVAEGEMENVSRVFNLAKQDVVGYEAYANQLASLLKGNESQPFFLGNHEVPVGVSHRPTRVRN